MGPRASGRMAAWGSGRSPSCRILTTALAETVHAVPDAGAIPGTPW